MSAKRVLGGLLNGVAFFQYSQALHWLFFKDHGVISRAFGSQFVFLTVLGLVASYVVQVLGIVAAVTGSRFTKSLKDGLNKLSAPLELVISILYWSIKAYDPKLLINEEIQERIPLWVDVSIHLLPSAVGSLDALFFSSRWRTSFVSIVSQFSVCALAYWHWVDYAYSYNGFYPYPLFGLVTKEARIGIFAGAVFIASTSFILLKSFQRLFPGGRL
jgi:FAR-17a/AIG1-like protein